jgi:nucleoid DNA-binding protein
MNIQQTIVTGIRAELHRHDFVVVPGFGGFVLKKRPAHFSPGGGVLVPPSKSPGFNVQLKQDDGILSSWLQNALTCSQQEARSHLDSFAQYCSSVLSARRRLALPGIGLFYLDIEDNICFEPQADANFLTGSFGLTPVQVPASAEPRSEPRLKTQQRTVARTDTRRRLPVQNAAIVSAVVMLAVFAFTWMLMSMPANQEWRAALFGSTGTPAYSPVTYPSFDDGTVKAANEEFVADATGHAVIELDGKKYVVKVSGRLNTKNAGTTAKRIRSAAAFELVIGCFENEENAVKLVKRMKRKNFDAGLGEKNARGLRMVNAGAYADHNEALRRLDEVRKLIPGAWIRRTR